MLILQHCYCYWNELNRQWTELSWITIVVCSCFTKIELVSLVRNRGTDLNQSLFLTQSIIRLQKIWSIAYYYNDTLWYIWCFFIFVMELARNKNRLWALDVLKTSNISFCVQVIQVCNEMRTSNDIALTVLMRIRWNKMVFMFIWINISWLFQHMSSLSLCFYCMSLFVFSSSYNLV